VPPTLLVTKLRPPVVPPQAVVRERLFERLRAGRGAKLTLVACPAGSGKSTLLAAWAAQDPVPAAWVSLDERDDDAVVLWAHAIEALRAALPALPHEALAGLVASSPLAEVALPRLVNELAGQGEVTLVLDDFHRLSSAAAYDSVAWFAEHAPGGVQLVIATRADPRLPLARLRARGQLLELRAAELRFDEHEAGEFLNERLGLGLADEDVAHLVARTEGWPAGIYLAALSLAGHEDKPAFVRAFDGTSAHVVDFLSAEVLAGYEPERQAFMLRVSVLERMCGALCDAVTGGEGSQAALASLVRTNLFLLPLDDQRRWFRFHHLFAQLLRVELERREPGAAAELHRRAAVWHAERGTTEEAIHHALEAGAHDLARELIAGGWVHYVNAGRTSSVAEWLHRFPGGRLELVAAWIAALRGDEAGMRAALARLGPLAPGALPDGFASAESSLAVLRTAFAWGDVGASLREGERAARLEGPGSPWRPVVTWALGWGHYCYGELGLAREWLEETRRIGPEADQWVVTSGAIADLSLLAGSRDEQMELALEAVATAAEHGLLEAREVGEVHTAYGVALAAHGRREEALAELEQGVFLRRLWGQPLDLADGLIALGRVAGRPEAFAEAEALLARCPDPGVLPARLAAARGRPEVGAELSEREKTVLRLLSGDLSEREIGQELFLSFHTVHSHVKSIYRKLGVSTRAGAVERARRFT
jgi:LuxR family maltose regulon positive regulatory protein